MLFTDADLSAPIDPATKVRLPRDPMRMFADLISMRWRSIGKNYSQ